MQIERLNAVWQNWAFNCLNSLCKGIELFEKYKLKKYIHVALKLEQ